MNYYLGISSENKNWHTLNLMFGYCVLVITLYTPKTKLPKYYFYKKEDVKPEVMWFLGLKIKNLCQKK